MQAARFFARVYNPTGTTIRRTLDTSLFLTVPTIVRQVGNLAGDISIDLALHYDNFGYGSSTGINPFDLVKLYAVNDSNPGGLLVYQGHIEEIVGALDKDGNDHVTIRLFPIDALFNRYLWKKLGSYVINYVGTDFITILSDAIDDVNSIYGASFFTKNLATPALSFTLAITRQTHLTAIQNAAKFLLSTWYWRIRANGQIDLQQYNDVTPTHSLTLGKDIDSLNITKSLLNTKNKIVESWGAGPTDTEFLDATSIANFGTRILLNSNSNVTDLPSANVEGAGLLSQNKDIFTKTIIVVNSQYPIETIMPGDTIKVKNVTAGSQQMLSGVVRIKQVEYNGSIATLQIADITDNYGTELLKLIR